jgi:hypothetical protein
MANLQPPAPVSVGSAAFSPLNQMNAAIPTAQTTAAMPPAVGIGTLPGMNMSSGNMLAGMGPGQQNMAGDYLRSQGMVGFV